MTEQQWERHEFAGFWLRVAAVLVDLVVALIVFAALVLLVPPVVDTLAADVPIVVVLGIVGGVVALVALLYDVLMTAGLGGTLGKRAAGIEVRSRDGERIEVGRALGRSCGRLVSVLPAGLGLLWVGWDRRKQGWHDKLAKTVVVKRRHLPLTLRYPEVPWWAAAGPAALSSASAATAQDGWQMPDTWASGSPASRADTPADAAAHPATGDAPDDSHADDASHDVAADEPTASWPAGGIGAEGPETGATAGDEDRLGAAGSFGDSLGDETPAPLDEDAASQAWPGATDAAWGPTMGAAHDADEPTDPAVSDEPPGGVDRPRGDDRFLRSALDELDFDEPTPASPDRPAEGSQRDADAADFAWTTPDPAATDESTPRVGAADGPDASAFRDLFDETPQPTSQPTGEPPPEPVDESAREPAAEPPASSGPAPGGDAESLDPNVVAIERADIAIDAAAWLQQVASQVDPRLDQIAADWRDYPQASAARACAFGLLLGHLATLYPHMSDELEAVAEAHPSFTTLLAGSRLVTLQEIAGDQPRAAAWLGPLIGVDDETRVAALLQ